MIKPILIGLFLLACFALFGITDNHFDNVLSDCAALNGLDACIIAKVGD